MALTLNKQTDYALRWLSWLAKQPAATAPTLNVAATSLKLSLVFLQKISWKLQRVGLVRAVRGRTGGYSLGRPARQITVAEVVGAMEDTATIVPCLLRKKSCPHAAYCKNLSALQIINAAIWRYLATWKLTDL